MSAVQRHPFEPLFATLTSMMSTPRAPVTHAMGSTTDAEHTSAERVVWIPEAIEDVVRPFKLPDDVSPCDEAWDFAVSVYGPTLLRCAALRSLLSGHLDTLLGPIHATPGSGGCAPSADATPAVVTGTVDLAALVYPLAALEGLSLAFLAPMARTLAFPLVPLANPVAVALAVRDAATAAGVPVLAGLTPRDEMGRTYLQLEVPTDSLSGVGAQLRLDPAAPSSACAALGLAGTLATGTPPTTPYRPGYAMGKTTRFRGGSVDAGGWGLIVPVRLFQPVRSSTYLKAIILETPLTTGVASDAAGDDFEQATSTP